MMGGDDLWVEGASSGAEIDLTVRWLRTIWRDAMVEVPGRPVLPIRSGRLFPLTYAAEAFIYRDPASFESWRRDGLTDENADAVIWVSSHEEALSFVVNDRNSASGKLVRELLENIERNRWLLRGIIPSPREAA
ncbi:MAG TPA: hypothetical protein VEU33_05565 [Archangium sp.]|nr:hypothetical protein [Archangium sp.]